MSTMSENYIFNVLLRLAKTKTAALQQQGVVVRRPLQQSPDLREAQMRPTLPPGRVFALSEKKHPEVFMRRQPKVERLHFTSLAV